MAKIYFYPLAMILFVFYSMTTLLPTNRSYSLSICSKVFADDYSVAFLTTILTQIIMLFILSQFHDYFVTNS